MAKQDVKVELSYGGAWNDVTFADDVRARDPVEITRGRPDELSATPPDSASLTFDNNDGDYNPRNPTSPLFGIGRNLPCRISVGSDIRFYGGIASWTPQRAIKGDAWTQARAGGTMRRLGRGKDPLRSALRRFIAGQSPVAHWSFEEGAASEFISLTSGSGTAFRRYLFSGAGTFEPGTGELAAWSGTGGLLRGVVTIEAFVGMANSPTQWAVDFIVKGDSLSGGDVMSLIMDGPAGDGSDSWQIDMYASLEEIDIFEPGAGSNANTYAGLFDGSAQRHVRFAAVQDGADVDYTLYIDGEVIVTDTAGTITLQPIRHILFSPGEGGVSVGDLVVWGTPPAIADAYEAAIGHLGETTANRFTRLCTEEGITSSVVGDADDCPEMGPQFPDTLANLLREIETTDDGFIYDLRDDAGLGMRTGRSCWNQDAVLALDWNAYEIGPPSDPVVDDLNVRNDVTAARRSAGTARAVRESGPLNVQAPEDDDEGVGRYTHQVDVNPFSDLVVPDYASWHLHRGTVDETRWPAVTVDLVATAGVDVSGVEIGDRLTIANVPAELSPDTVSLVILGWAETIGTHTRRITFNCAPESPLHIAEVEHSLYATVGSSATYRRSSVITNVQTSITFTIEEGPDWVFETAFDILVGGERMTVTAIAAASGTYPARTQVFTVIRSVNGVVKSHPVGAKVELFHQSHYGL